MRIIKSSEISSYLFCPVSWWIGITGGVKITRAIRAGDAHHAIIAKNEPKARKIYIWISILTLLIVLLLIYRLFV